VEGPIPVRHIKKLQGLRYKAKPTKRWMSPIKITIWGREDMKELPPSPGVALGGRRVYKGNLEDRRRGYCSVERFEMTKLPFLGNRTEENTIPVKQKPPR